MRLPFKSALTVVALAAASLLFATPAHANVTVAVDYTLTSQSPRLTSFPGTGTCNTPANWYPVTSSYAQAELIVPVSGEYRFTDKASLNMFLVPDGRLVIMDGALDVNDVSNCVESVDDQSDITLAAGTYQMYLTSYAWTPLYGNFGYEISGPGEVTVNLLGSSTVSVDAPTVDTDTAATITATPASDTPGADLSGTVTFLLDGSELVTASIDPATGSASFIANNIAVGTHTITARYSGVPGATEPSTGTGTLTVVRTQTTTTLDISPTEIVDGDQTTYTATVSGLYPSGNVEFYNGTTLVGISPIVDGVASVTVSPSVGTYNITAYYFGDANYTASDSQVKTLLVKLAGNPSTGSDPKTGQPTQTVTPKRLPNTGTDAPNLVPPIAASVALVAGLALMLTRRKQAK
ncbi:Ig-like domain repeat protein [Leucobacter sp. UT-8R-CII-1-4]|uniref:Ig-like domain repeat protein n=1 Tax=Leucobacter sp. UT-8R-CII-1-4 TaxID=3040075 RepID=UPI0024A8C535|nr:Ig-like domain repeat protein [Leucobacter sp. UT-8R-CII-1-4]MDI6024453.1 Ig-like domain repeat protein [Leucobacter sp. UT-8R-CII-1-4]